MKSKQQTAISRTSRCRRSQGATLPLVVFCLAVTFAMLAVSIDVMRTAYCASLLQNAAQSAGLHALFGAYNDDGELKSGETAHNIAQALAQTNGASGSAWFQAPAGPSDDGITVQTPVIFDPADLFVNNINPDNAGDLQLSLKARRDGLDALKLKFLPLIYGFGSLFGQPSPQGIDQANPYRVAEVCLQPATRIGGARTDNSGPVQSNFASPRICASFPIALSNNQWQTIAQPAQTNLLYNIKIAGSKHGNQASAANEISGCFVNITRSGSSDYYGDAAGNLAVSQLFDNLAAFSGDSPYILSAPVERDSRIAALDADAQAFTSRAQQIAARLNKLIAAAPSRFYILPVLETDPIINGRNRVAGFGRMRMVKVTFDAEDNSIKLQMEIGQSRPMANASVGTQAASVPQAGSAFIQASRIGTVFSPRYFSQGVLSALPRGIVMAPALSPRAIQGGRI